VARRSSQAAAGQMGCKDSKPEHEGFAQIRDGQLTHGHFELSVGADMTAPLSRVPRALAHACFRVCANGLTDAGRPVATVCWWGRGRGSTCQGMSGVPAEAGAHGKPRQEGTRDRRVQGHMGRHQVRLFKLSRSPLILRAFLTVCMSLCVRAPGACRVCEHVSAAARDGALLPRTPAAGEGGAVAGISFPLVGESADKPTGDRERPGEKADGNTHVHGLCAQCLARSELPLRGHTRTRRVSE